MNQRLASPGNWVGRTVEVLAKTLDLRSQNHAIIAGNLANMDTPGYKPRELEFEKELQRAIGQGTMQPRKTHEKHLPGGIGDIAAVKPQLKEKNYHALGNGSFQLDLDREMAKLAQNNLAYEATVQLIAKKLTSLRLAITEGGK